MIVQLHQLIVYSTIKDSNGQPVEGAMVEVQGIDKHVKTTERGEYWRLLNHRTRTDPLKIYM